MMYVAILLNDSVPVCVCVCSQTFPCHLDYAMWSFTATVSLDAPNESDILIGVE